MSISRRPFLSLLGAAALPLGGCAPNLVVAGSSVPTDRMLILIELDGGNDGLNTVIPYRQDAYYRRFRPTIGIPRSDVLALDQETGLHPTLKPLIKLFEQDEISIAHNIGYPAPSRSHFSSMAIVQSGVDGRSTPGRGWVAKTLDDHDIEHDRDLLGVTMDGALGPMKGGAGLYIDVGDVDRLHAATGPARASGTSNPLLNTILARRRLYDDAIQILRGKLETVSVDDDLLDPLPGGDLGRQAKRAVRLIAAGVRVPVIKLSLSGFDTHGNQAGKHRRLLKQLARTIRGLQRSLVRLGRWDDTVIVTYSEFGRNPQENASGGTDHGTAAPHLIAGGRISGRKIGEIADLERVQNDTLEHEIDYRAMLERVISDHLDVADNPFSHHRSPALEPLLRNS